MHPTTASSTPAQRIPKKPGLLINRNFALLWSGQTISVIGDFAFSTTLAVWVFTLVASEAWAPLAVTGVYIATALPMILVGPLAGVFVDRWNKRRTMLVMDVLSAILVAALLPLTGIVPLNALAQLPGVGDTRGSALGGILVGGQLPLEWQLGTIYAVVFLVSAVGQFFSPSRTALIGDLVPDPLRGRAMGLSQGSQSIALLLGTLIAPPLFVTFGAQWTLTFDALSFVVSYLTIRAIQAPASASSIPTGARGRVVHELVAGIRFSLRSRVLRTILIAAIIVMAGAGLTNSLDIFFVTGNLHTEISLYGVLNAAVGAGMIVGAIVGAAFSGALGYARTLWMSLLGMGVLMLVYSRLTDFGPALAIMVVFGVMQAVLSVAIGPLLLSVTPRTLVGRTNALLNLVLTVASLAGTAVAGYLAGTLLSGLSANLFGFTFGPIDTIFTFSGIFVLAGGLYCALNLRSKTVERERVVEPAPMEAESGEQQLLEVREPLASATM